MVEVGMTTSDRLARERILGLTVILELSINQYPPKFEQAISTAAMIRNIVREGAHLTNSEKAHLIKSLAMIKAKAYASGSRDALAVYKKLDTISDELVQLL